ncbi:acetyltransferase [Yersinia ruckeri]|uniref:acetyltransferase n=1 Tax=Yersinia ruckeri TaxID=29486 RepID=UPI002238B773|nr:acetyltransferase [Yersinia ruckeri]EKN4699095.1 acetyltransferase [Yersinia ruckeri]MCW6541588.1 acetyltransferase [Yersinia ruckeri]MCW6564756.1 acetyltransferase [Yersinia ruckeri]MCW6576000.1 acetyltransferase [Yersinia ruckeri]MCW6583880.1 acetyltransferase [Yersinia ruckeri]
MSSKPLIIIGGGGHASVLVGILKKQHRDILAIISPADISGRVSLADLPHLRGDEEIMRFAAEDVELINGVGVTPGSSLRRKVNEHFLSKGYRFATVISEDAIVSDFAVIHKGAQILTRAIIQPGTVIGSHSVVNTAATIEHDCHIGSYNFIAPGATLCGDVRTSDNVFIGAGATIIPGVHLDDGAFVSAGAVLVSSLGAGKRCYAVKTVIK